MVDFVADFIADVYRIDNKTLGRQEKWKSRKKKGVS